MHQERSPTSRAGVVLALAAAAWGLLAWMVLDMGHPLVQLAMPGTSEWEAANVMALFGMWAVMMGAMMLPSALPTVSTFVQLNVHQGDRARAHAFVAAYLVVWSAFGGAATALQWLLQRLDWISPMIASTSPVLDSALLLLGGAYQLSPVKRICLSRCRSPAAALIAEWRPGTSGAFVMGLRHGAACTGCCWSLMLLLFIGGAMNIGWIAALSLVVAMEKWAPHGERIGRMLGVGLLAAGMVKAASFL